MTRIEWDQAGTRRFEAGVDQCVLYPNGVPGVPWSGVTSIGETSSGGDLSPLYFDGVKYADILGNEDFTAQLSAFGAPPEFAACDGRKQLVTGLFVTQQPRKTFGLCYRTLIGNDLVSTDYGYKLHVVYNCTAAPTSKMNETIGATINPDVMSWSIDTVPPPASTFRPTAHIVLDSTLILPAKMDAVMTAFYGGPVSAPYLPTIAQIVAMVS